MEDWITQLEAAELRGVAVQVINNWVRRGRVRTREQYGKVLVSRSEIQSYEPMKPGPKPKTEIETDSKAGKKKSSKKR